MKSLIIKYEHELKESISIKSRDIYKENLLICNILPLTNIILEYLDILIEIYNDKILVNKTSLLSVKDIPGNSIVKVKEDINLIHVKSELICLTKNLIDIEWFKNYTLVEQSNMVEVFQFLNKNRDDNICPYIIGNLDNERIRQPADIIIIQSTKEGIKLREKNTFFIGKVTKPIYLFMFGTSYTYIDIEGKVNIKRVFLSQNLREYLSICKVFDNDNKLIYNGGMIWSSK